MWNTLSLAKFNELNFAYFGNYKSQEFTQTRKIELRNSYSKSEFGKFMELSKMWKS